MASERDVPLAYIVVGPGGPDERTVPIFGRIFVGRECVGIEHDYRLVVEDPAMSRDHLEIRLDLDSDRAHVIDRSTNGTRVNGVRIMQARAVEIRPGDSLQVGDTLLEFRSELFAGARHASPRRTTRRVDLTELAMVVGDVVGYSSISQHTDDKVLLDNVDRLYDCLGETLATYGGTLNNYVGDAFFALWEVDAQPGAPQQAMNFALDAAERVGQVAPELALRDPSGRPVHLGWAVVVGRAAVGALGGMFVSVMGDATNLAFRLSGLAGREGRPEILATAKAAELAGDAFVFDAGEEVEVKGRKGAEQVVALRGRRVE